MGKLVSLRPVTSYLGSRLLGRRLLERACEVVQIAPGVERETLPAISLPHEFERVTGTVPSTSVPTEWERLTASAMRHGPTLNYRFSNALLANKSVYASGAYDVHGARRRRAVVFGNCVDVDEGQLCTHSEIDRYFGHWLLEGMSMEILAEELQLPPLTFSRRSWLHEAGYRDLMCLPQTAMPLARVRRLWIPDNRGLNDSWIARAKALRKRVRGTADGTGPEYVLMLRGKTGASRELLNEEQVARTLAARGFRILNPEESSVGEIVSILADARILVSVEGSALAHAMFALPRHSAILTIQAPYFFNAALKVFTDALGMRFAYVVADAAEGGFRIDQDRLLQTIEKVEVGLS